MVRKMVVRLAAGDLRLELSPSIGGAISALEWDEGDRAWPILRKCNSPPKSALEAASFPLVPYVNRIRGGRFSFRGREVRLKPNMAGDPSPLHGQGWQSPWEVDRADEASASLTYRHTAGEWPWSYEGRQDYAMDERGLSVTVACRNLDAKPMPCGLGQHPYFPCGPETSIDTRVRDVWTIDEHVLPVEKLPATGRYGLDQRKVCGQDLDHGFGGWNGEARITDPAWPFDLIMASGDARF